MTHGLPRHVEKIQLALANDQQTPEHKVFTITSLLFYFQRASFEVPRPFDRAAAAHNFERNLASVTESGKDLPRDLGVFWSDPGLSDFTTAELDRLARALISKYTPELTTVAKTQ